MTPRTVGFGLRAPAPGKAQSLKPKARSLKSGSSKSEGVSTPRPRPDPRPTCAAAPRAGGGFLQVVELRLERWIDRDGLFHFGNRVRHVTLALIACDIT